MKKAQFDIAIYGIPAFFLLILILAIFTFYFALISQDLPAIDAAKIDDDTLSLINLLKTQINEKETFSDLIRQSIKNNDFKELDEKTQNLLKVLPRWGMIIYDKDDNVIHQANSKKEIAVTTSTIKIPFKSELIKIAFGTKELSDEYCKEISYNECSDSNACVLFKYKKGTLTKQNTLRTSDQWDCFSCVTKNCPRAPDISYCNTFTNLCNADCYWETKSSLTKAKGCVIK